MRVSNIPINQEFREDVRIMCNLSTGIEERATERATKKATEKTSEKFILNMYKKGYTLHILLLSIRSKVLLLTRTSLLQILRELCRSLHRNYSDLRQKLSSDHITSRSQSQAQRWMYPVSSVVVKAAVSVKVPAGLKSLAAVWFIRMY